MNIIPYKSEHIQMMTDYGQQESLVRPFLDEMIGMEYESKGPAFTGVADGKVIGCAGLVEVTKYRAYVWAALSKQDIPQRFVAIHRAALDFLAQQKYRRIDAQVAYEDRAGHRWAKMLGFKREVFCRPWVLHNGGSVSEYVRFN